MSFLTLPIAVGAITMGPAVGALLGGVFGAVSFYDAITGASAMTGALFQVSPVNTFILCVGMRVLMGLCVRPDLQRPEALRQARHLELHPQRHERPVPEHGVLHGLDRAGLLRLRLRAEPRVRQGCCEPLHVRGAAGRRAGRGRVPCLRHSGRHRSPCCGKVRKIKDVPDVRAAHSIIVIKNSSGESWRSFFTTNISPA